MTIPKFYLCGCQKCLSKMFSFHSVKMFPCNMAESLQFTAQSMTVAFKNDLSSRLIQIGSTIDG